MNIKTMFVCKLGANNMVTMELLYSNKSLLLIEKKEKKNQGHI